MNFRDSTPEQVFINPNADSFISVLDGLKTYEDLALKKACRFFHPAISTNLDFLRKKVADYGYPPVPEDFPKDVLDALILNAKYNMDLRGSLEGLELWLWCLTFGEITIDASGFYPQPDYILLSDIYYGYASHVSPIDAVTYNLYLFTGTDNFGDQEIVIDIVTKYSSNDSIKDYIEANIREFLMFTADDTTITINYTNGPYVTLDTPYQYLTI